MVSSMVCDPSYGPDHCGTTVIIGRSGNAVVAKRGCPILARTIDLNVLFPKHLLHPYLLLQLRQCGEKLVSYTTCCLQLRVARLALITAITQLLRHILQISAVLFLSGTVTMDDFSCPLL
ncbi:unnamed protein product [Zymoseptoria tritici ST99CH_1A5]|uniref:Uncharacterized protein n=1 Tax=Zymoseptoria tritici ST99CH_1A5 TaxID=1276529 RepID=A0A1Y6LX20_ZYMTR|nr:unnamed protein product [Zymoseptoria tritici ST99CH_1A5]